MEWLLSLPLLPFFLSLLLNLPLSCSVRDGIQALCVLGKSTLSYSCRSEGGFVSDQSLTL